MKLNRLIFFFLSFLISLCNLSLAEVVQLKSGKVFEGRIVKVEDFSLTISVNENPISIGYDQIANVQVSPDSSDGGEFVGQINKKLNERQQKIDEQSERIAQRIKSKKVELYMTTWCPYCQKLMKFFREKGIKYTRYDVEHDMEGIRKYREMNVKGVPVVKIDGVIIRGWTPSSVWKELIK